MPRCTNSVGNYTGNEPSPKGLGKCAKGYDLKKDVGHTQTGADGKSWTLHKQRSKNGTEYLIWRKQVTNLETKAPVKTTGVMNTYTKHDVLKASDYVDRVTSNGDNAEGHVCRIGNEMKCLQIDKGGAKWWKKGTRSNSACQWDLEPPRDCHAIIPPRSFPPSRSPAHVPQKKDITDLCALISQESVRLTGTDVDRVRDILDYVLTHVRSGDQFQNHGLKFADPHIQGSVSVRDTCVLESRAQSD
jgi:hypothetical protein